MRRQDELLALYPGQETLTRKFILTQLEAYAHAAYSEEILEFLQAALSDPDPVLRHQALASYTRFLPEFVRRRYSLTQYSLGVWSSFRKRGGFRPESARDGHRHARRRREACLAWADPLAAELASVGIGDPQPASREPSALLLDLVLGAFPQEPCRRALEARIRSGNDCFAPLLAWAALSGLRPEDALLLDALDRGATSAPDVLLLAAHLDPRNAVDRIRELAPRTTALGRINLATALAACSGAPGRREVIEELLGFREGWVTVGCLKAAEAGCDPEDLTWVVRQFEQSAHPFVRTQAIRAAGGLPGTPSIEFCSRVAAGSDAAMGAQCLESLVRLRAPSEEIRAVAIPMLASASARARANAILASFDPEAEELPALIPPMLLSRHTVERVEAAYCLGYIQNQKALVRIIALIRGDPSAHVRLQSIKSLSRYPARISMGPLLDLVSSPDTGMALTAARALSRYEDLEASLICETLKETLPRLESPFARALLHRAYGILARRGGLTDAEDVLGRALDQEDPRVQLGILEGLAYYGRGSSRELDSRLSRAAASADPRIRARALLARFNLGELDALPGLTRSVTCRDENSHFYLETLLEIGLLITRVDLDQRFPALESRLDELSAPPALEPEPETGSDSPLEPAEPGAAGREPVQAGDEFPVRRGSRILKPLTGDSVTGLDPSATNHLKQLCDHLDLIRQEAPPPEDELRSSLGQVTYHVGAITERSSRRRSPAPRIRPETVESIVMGILVIVTGILTILWLRSHSSMIFPQG